MILWVAFHPGVEMACSLRAAVPPDVRPGGAFDANQPLMKRNGVTWCHHSCHQSLAGTVLYNVGRVTYQMT